jgi:hypothetical protein
MRCYNAYLNTAMFSLSRYGYCYYISKLPLISMSYEVDYYVPFIG